MNKSEKVKLNGLTAGFILYMTNRYAVPKDLAILQGTYVFIFLNEYLPLTGHSILRTGESNDDAVSRIHAGVLELHDESGGDAVEPDHAPDCPAGPSGSKR